MAVTTPVTAPTAPPRHDAATATAAAAAGGWSRRLAAPADLASIAVFRMMFGLLLLWEVWRYVSAGWVNGYYVDPAFNFTYAGFSWVRPLPAAGMMAVFAVLGVAALMFALGAWYRSSAIVLAVGYTYVFLLEQARYLNHFYLICLFAAMMVLVPAGRVWSVDALVRPDRRADVAPRWWLALLQTQLAVVYAYAGLAKLNEDWLSGEPMRAWLADRTDVALIGRWFTEEWMVLGMSWGGLLFDLLIIPALLWRRTRVVAVLAAISFHLLNEELFQIGIFPWFAMAATTLFFRPDWPRRILRLAPATGAVATSGAGPRLRRTAGVLLVVFVAAQVLVPLRHLAIPGDVAWTEEGHRFAWRMKLRTKSADTAFRVTDPATGATRTLDPRSELESWQATSMQARPDMIAQFARHLADRAEADGFARPEVRVDATASLNGRPTAVLVDPDVDLAAQPAWDVHRDWIPLAEAPRRPNSR